MIYKLEEGLGDCLLAGACLEHSPKEFENIKFKTNSKLDFLFQNHPRIKLTTNLDDTIFTFKWVSQCNRKDFYSLHTSQRFSIQLNYLIDPTKTLSIYDANKNQLFNNSEEKIICINVGSAEGDRRKIPLDCIDLILKKFSSDYKIIFIGAGYNNSIQDISEIVSLLKKCSLFIGPVSFCYHLAACLNTKSLLFTGYMPYYKFSHFKNTMHFYNIESTCSQNCEMDNIQCNSFCNAQKYDLNQLNLVLENTKIWIENK